MKFVQVLLNLLLLTSLCKHNSCYNVDEERNEILPPDVAELRKMNPANLQSVKFGYEEADPPYIPLKQPQPVLVPLSLEQGLLKELTKKIGDSSKILLNKTKRRSDSLQNENEDVDMRSKPVLFTIGSSDTGLHWNQIPYREKFQWHTHEAPCHPFKLRVPHETQVRSVIDVCIYRDHLDFKEDSIVIMHNHQSTDDEKKEMRVLGQVDKFVVSTVTGKIVDTFFYGEISVQDPITKETTVYVIEEINFLSQLIRNNGKVMRTLLAVMNSGVSYNSPPVKYNAVITQGVSIVNFITNGNPEEITSKPILIFSTGHNSYITPGDAIMTVEDSGRIAFTSQGNAISIDVDGSVQFKTDNKEYTFRPNGRTIVKEGMNVRTLQEHEGSVALTAFTSSTMYSCMLPTPAFSARKQGGYLCKVCLATDSSFEKYFSQHHTDTMFSSSRYLGQIIDKVSWIFRATDWDNNGSPDNIGLDWDTQSFEWSYTSDIRDENISEDELDGLFKSLAEIDFSECCLGIAYTMKKFPESIFAKSSASKATPTGGICSTRAEGLSSNIILISANDKNGKELNEEKLTYITAHEIAKTFGASADVTGQLECDQFMQDKENIGHFILWPNVMRDITAAEKTFSPCSKKSISDTLASCKSACFDIDKHPFCGNGIVEDSEECDCGDEHSCSKQECCYGRNDKQPCRKTGIKCKKSSSAVRISVSFGILSVAQVLISFH